jgi:HK97 gp10 family phage protein
MDFSFKIEGLDKIGQATTRVQAEVRKELEKALYASALRIEKEAKKSILSGNKSGRVYTTRFLTNKKTGGIFPTESRPPHKASAKGEAPASDTGRLVNSITTYVKKTGALEAFVVAGRGTVKYARMLEYGTAKMGARPFMIPAYEKSKAWIQERLNKAVVDAAIKSTRK